MEWKISKPVEEYEKFEYSQKLTFDAEGQQKIADYISTHEDILELSFDCILDFNVTVAAATGVISIYDIIDKFKLVAGAYKYYDNEGQELQAISALWQPPNFNMERKDGGGDVPLTVANNIKVKFSFTLPAFVKKNTRNLELEIRTATIEDAIEAGGATLVFNELVMEIYPRYESLDEDEFTRVRGNKFWVENSLYVGSANGEEHIFFKTGAMLDFLIVFCKDITSTKTRANTLESNFDYIQLEHENENIVYAEEESYQITQKEVGLRTRDVIKTLDSENTTEEDAVIYFFDIDEVVVDSNTELSLKYNASMLATDRIHVIKGYTML